MATIALYKNSINRVGFQLESVINSSDKLSSQLNVLKNVLQGVDSSTCDLQDAVDSITSSTKSESDMVEDVRRLNTKLSEFINTAVERDDSARSEIVREKNEFYKKYSYLKPDCEKKKKSCMQKLKAAVKATWELCRGYWEEHCHELKIVITIGIVVAALAVVICCPGAGAIVAGACWGAISGACIGGVAGGINSQIHDGEFWDGFVNGSFDGAITGAIGGTITGGLESVWSQSTVLSKNVGRAIAIGAVSSGPADATVTAIDYYLEKGYIDGASDEIITAGISGALFGGLTGGLTSYLRKSPAILARGEQGTFPYLGKDKYVNRNMHAGDVIWRGEPGGKGFFTSLDAVESSGRNRVTLFRGLQVAPHETKGFRPRVCGYRFTQTVTVGYGQALANPDLGGGGLEQYYVPNVKELIDKGILEYVDTIELGGL